MQVMLYVPRYLRGSCGVFLPEMTLTFALDRNNTHLLLLTFIL